MKTDDAIFSLVHSMSTAERRFMKRLSASSSDPENYLTLFSLIEQQKSYDEEALKKQLKKKGAGKHFSWSKNYLTAQVLRSLRAYHSGPWAILEALDILKSVEILYRKVQTKTCKKLVRKGIALCEEYEFWNLHLEFVSWEYKLLAKTGDYRGLLNFPEDGQKRKARLISDMALYNEAEGFLYHSDVIMNRYAYYKPEEIQAFNDKTLPQIAMLLKQSGHSFRLQETLLWVQATCYALVVDSKNELEVRKKILALYEQYPQFKNDVPFKYYATWINYIYGLNRNGAWQEVLDELEKLKKFIYGTHKAVKTDMLINASSGLMRLTVSSYLQLNEEKKALDAAYSYEKVRPQIRAVARRINVLNDNMFLARVYFRNKMYDRCSTLVREVLVETEMPVNTFVLMHAHLLRICIQLAQKKWDKIPLFISLAQKELERTGMKDPYAEEFFMLAGSLAEAKGKLPPSFSAGVEEMDKLVTMKFIIYTDVQLFLRDLLKKESRSKNN